MDDLRELLELKMRVESIKKEAENPNLDAETKLERLDDLQEALDKVETLKGSIHEPCGQ